MSKKYSTEEFTQMLKLKDEIIGVCEICKGKGFTLVKGLDYTCDCQLVFQYVRQLILSGISSEYWTLSLATLTLSPVYKKILRTYTKHLRSATRKGLGVFLMGENGIGKTTFLAEIGKQSIAKGYTIQYITQERYIQWTSPRGMEKHSHELARLEDAQIILFDELGKGYIKESSVYVSTKIEEFLRRKLSEGVAVSVCSNYNLDHLEEVLGSSTMSVLERHLKFITMEGKDHSPVRQDNWLQELEEGFDYMHPTLIQLARRMSANAED